MPPLTTRFCQQPCSERLAPIFSPSRARPPTAASPACNASPLAAQFTGVGDANAHAAGDSNERGVRVVTQFKSTSRYTGGKACSAREASIHHRAPILHLSSQSQMASPASLPPEDRQTTRRMAGRRVAFSAACTAPSMGCTMKGMAAGREGREGVGGSRGGGQVV